MAKAQRTTSDVVRDIMAALPDVEEFVSHGQPTFRVRGHKVFATYTINHHGDGRVALRFCFVNWRATGAHVEEVVALLGALGDELAKDGV